MAKVLVVVTGVDSWTLSDGTPEATGYWAEEFVVPHEIFVGAGHDVTIATPGGVKPTPDELSFSLEMNGGSQETVDHLRTYVTETIADQLEHPAKLEDLDPNGFDAVFIPGGHGPMEDLAKSEALGKILVAMADNQDKVVSAVCHGPAGLVPAVRDDGSWAFEGRQVTSFSDEEETQYGYREKTPFLLESRLSDIGGKFSAGEPWQPHVIVDGNLITGANPASSDGIARALVDALAAKG
ncbi:MAG: type 1 glutamine amidotransferase domain-containing protein [Acidimicrobiia bacterium]